VYNGHTTLGGQRGSSVSTKPSVLERVLGSGLGFGLAELGVGWLVGIAEVGNIHASQG